MNLARIARARGFPWAMAAAGIAVAVPAFDFLYEIVPHLDQARTRAAGQLMPSDLPMTVAVGQSLVLSPFVAVADVAGVVALQAGAYALSIWLAWDMLRRHGASAQALGGVVLLLCRWMLGDRGRGPGTAVALGAVLGSFVLLRRNAVVFVLLPVLARKRSRWIATCPGTGVLVHVAGAWIGTGDLLYFPGNGPYIFASGNNEFTRPVLLAGSNGERSLPDALAAIGMAGAPPYCVPADVYWRMATKFIVEHPLGALWRARAFGLTRPDWLFVSFVLLFSAPFLITSADPRYRLPLDQACIAVAVAWIDAERARRRCQRTARSMPFQTDCTTSRSASHTRS